ncbi:MAG TPA: hypothetical protein VM008_08645 [Phycisphaerae bacterium]|nr:hypothetical protein [Phycisphaerae bacterium]
MLHEQAQAAIVDFKNADPSIQHFFDNAHAYVVFPNITAAAAGVGGAGGAGETYEQGKFAGYADVTKGSVGAQVGAEKFAEIIFFETTSSYLDFTNSVLELDAQATAVAASRGAGATASYRRGVAIFTMPLDGLMAQAAIGGQKFRYEAADQPTR